MSHFTKALVLLAALVWLWSLAKIILLTGEP